MIENPDKYIKNYADAGSDTIIIHYEASTDPIKDLQYIRTLGKKSGIATKDIGGIMSTKEFTNEITNRLSD